MARGKRTTPSAAMPAGAYAPPPPPDAFRKPSSAATDKSPPDDTLLHDLFSQQLRTVLDSSDLDDEEKQSILVAMNCPCCGAGGASFSVKMKRRT
jgi:hypothetical protein